jgi:CheY-like chemotaxis protein
VVPGNLIDSLFNSTMTRSMPLICRSLVLAAALPCCGQIFAQEPAVPAPAPAASPAVPASSLPESNPAVRAALELSREEPADYFQAVSWLIELGRPELAKPILAELTALPLTDAQRAALVEKFGSQAMLQLARAPQLAPAGGQFAAACMAAADAATRDSQRIAALVAQLTDPSTEVRHAARVDLAAAGQVGANATLEALARESNRQRRAALVSAAAQMGPLVAKPLLAMLDTRDPALRGIVIGLLKHLQVSQAIPLLPASAAAAEQALNDAIARYSADTQPFTTDAQNQVELWNWDDADKKLNARRYSADEARTIWLAHLSGRLRRVRPDNSTYRRQALVLELEAAALTDVTADRLLAVDAAMLNDALANALDANYPRAAVAVIDQLGKHGDASVLFTANAQPSPLADALASPNRRVRFAALRAIMAIDPKSPYPGSSRVPKALAYFAGGTGERRGIVAAPTAARASDLAGKLAAHSLAADGFNRGRDAVEISRNSADLELVLIDMDILVPDARQVVYDLRVHPATGEVPIALLAADGRLAAAQRIASQHDRVIAVSRPNTPEALAPIVARLQALADRDPVTPDQRAAEAVEATAWIAQLLAADRRFYALRRVELVLEFAVYQPNSNKSAIAALVTLGTPASQRALVNLASQITLPAASRAAAAIAFAESVKSHGVLLTADEIIDQYDRYNASQRADVDTQKVFAALLDAIESRRAAAQAVKFPAP